MLLSGPPLAGRRVVFVSGKGGVGKTSVAAALALGQARAGRRVLLVSTDPAHNLAHVWDRPVGDEPTRVATTGGGHVDALEIDPARTVDRHLAAVRTTMHRMLPERLHAQADRHLDLARDAPGTHESAVLERVAEAVELGGVDDGGLVVFDTAPTGHTLRLMTLPGQLTAWTESLLANRDRSERFGAALRGLGGGDTEVDRDAELRRVLVARRRRFAALRDAVTDAGTTSFVLVLTPERLPVLETLALHRRLVELGIDVGALVANRRSPADGGPLLAARRAQEDVHLATVHAELPDTPVVEVPLLPHELVGEQALRAMAVLLDR